MELQISSGQGPEECELGVYKLLCALRKEFPGMKVLDTVAGRRADCLRSARIESGIDLSFLEGTENGYAKARSAPRINVKTGLLT